MDAPAVPPKHSQAPDIPPVRDLVAAVADRSALKEAGSMLMWGLICIGIGMIGLAVSPINVLLLAFGIAMALAGAIFKSQRSLGAFVAGGVTLLLVGFWNGGMALLELLFAGSLSGSTTIFAILGVCQVMWAFGSFRRGTEFRAMLGGWSTVSSPEASALVAWLASSSPNAPGIIMVKVGSGQGGLSWRAVMGNDILFALHPVGAGCFWMPREAVDRALNGESIPIARTKLKMTIEPGQAQKLRQILWDRQTA
jgi:hypothetical protein